MATESLRTLTSVQLDNYATKSFETKARHKRCMDLVLAILLTIMITPVLIVIAVSIKISGGGPILFIHRRVGLAGQIFGCLKFRTMCPDADELLQQLLQRDPEAWSEWTRTRKLKHDPRVTRIGRLLRVTSLDELPQLFNVLRGDMSLVGPRPIMPDELLHHYKGAAGEAYMAVRPGLTGLWQVSGRSNVDYQERVAMDFEYVHCFSLRTDLRLLWRTVAVLLRARGAY